MSWNFILLIFINVCQCDESSLYSRINYVQFRRGTSGAVNDETERQQFKARTRIALCQRPGADTEEPTLSESRKICVVFWMPSVNSNELSKV